MLSLSLSRQRLFGQVAQLAGLRSRSDLSRRLAALLGRTELPGRAEFVQLRPASRVLILGLAAWIGLVCGITVAAVASVEISTMDFTWFGSHLFVAAGTEARSHASYENILLRPLFSRSRHGAVAAISALPPPPPPAQRDQNIGLKGVFINGAMAKAFLTSAQNPLGVWVQVDEEIAGWRLAGVEPDQVVLEAQNDKLVVPMGVQGAGINVADVRAKPALGTRSEQQEDRGKRVGHLKPDQVVPEATKEKPLTPLGIKGALR